MGTKHVVKVFRPSAGGKRRFAVTQSLPVAAADWCSGDLSCQSTQTWDVRIFARIADRGYVCLLSGGGQWSNRGDHGNYVGTGETAEAALLSAWRLTEDGSDAFGPDLPRQLVAACRDYDDTVQPSAVE